MKSQILILSSLFVFQVQAANEVPGEYLIRLNSKTISFASLENSGGFKIRRQLPGTNLFVAERSSLENLEFGIQSFKNLGIQAEPNRIYTISKIPNDPDLDVTWGLNAIEAPRAWDLTTGSNDVIVAIIDTGVNYNHEDLKNNIWTNEAELKGKFGVDDDKNGFIDDVHGYDFVNDDGDPMADHVHGTHVAGVIGASGNNKIGISGVNWKVKILPVKAMNSTGSGTTEMAINAINYAVKMKAKVLNNSWGGTDDSKFLEEAVTNAEKANAVFVAAAGNSFVSNDQAPRYPASFPNANVISVAALEKEGGIAGFSNWGAKSVHLAAPGVGIYSTYGKDYDSMSGTSMATPFVSGVAALVAAFDPKLTAVQIKDRILKGVIVKKELRDKVISRGVLNAYYAVSGEAPPPDLDEPQHWKNKKRLKISSEHPYKQDARDHWEISQPGAREISLHFEKFDLEDFYDRLILYNREDREIASYSGKEALGWIEPIRGDFVRIVLRTDARNQEYGFDLTELAYR